MSNCLILILILSLVGTLVFSLSIEKVSIARRPTLLISLDGLAAPQFDKFLAQNPDSYLNRLMVQQGVKADYMSASFPSLTFPNHYTMVTGLYPESHGVVGNTLFDPIYGRVNLLSDSSANDPKWWSEADPIWLTAKRQGFKVASFFWTGSEVWTRHPDIFFRYQTSLNYFQRCEEVVSWFTKFQMDFATLYFNEPDSTGHDHGPDSPEYMQKIRDVDETIGYLLTLFIRDGLFDKVNIIIVSDHGMANMKETIIVNTLINHALWINTTQTVYGIVSSIWPISDQYKENVYNGLKASPNLQVFYKEDMPSEYNYKNNKRIGPIVAIANEGYTLSTNVNTLKGNHGFDHRIESMRSIFLARGPDFKRNVKIRPIKNVDVYPLVCQLVNIRGNPNNGTIKSFENALTFTPTNLN